MSCCCLSTAFLNMGCRGCGSNLSAAILNWYPEPQLPHAKLCCCYRVLKKIHNFPYKVSPHPTVVCRNSFSLETSKTDLNSFPRCRSCISFGQFQFIRVRDKNIFFKGRVPILQYFNYVSLALILKVLLDSALYSYPGSRTTCRSVSASQL